MSAPLAGKFQDHYAVLGVDQKSDAATIQRAYATLAQKYAPNNSATGNPETFDALNLAYEVLSDPQQRSVFDKVKGSPQQVGSPKFTGVDFFDALGREALLRAAILCVLYDRRLAEPTSPSLSIRHLELILEASAARLSSALWYLKQRGLAASDDKSSLQITVDGMDFLESKRPMPENVMPFIKAAAIAVSPARPEQTPPLQAQSETSATSKRDPESVLSTLNRALAEIRK
jgi:curved DNA-binding protein CbpA